MGTPREGVTVRWGVGQRTQATPLREHAGAALLELYLEYIGTARVYIYIATYSYL
jgi:hypothetical protein